jgi:hypothetical protein
LRIKDVLGNANINKMHITNFLQKALMTFAFLVIPIILTKTYSWEIKDLWQVYIPSMILGLLAMGPACSTTPSAFGNRISIFGGIPILSQTCLIIALAMGLIIVISVSCTTLTICGMVYLKMKDIQSLGGLTAT